MKDLSDKVVYGVVGILVFSAFSKSDDYRTNPYPNTFEQPKTISVIGSADMLVPPDKITVDISYREYWYSKKKESIEEIEKNLLKVLEETGIPKSKITINSEAAWKYNWNYWHYWYDYNNRLVQKSLSVELEAPTQMDSIVRKLKRGPIRRNGILSIIMNKTDNSDIQKYRKMVKERAIQAAMDKADYLLSAVGKTKGSVVTIREMSDPKTTTRRQGGFYDYGWWGYPYYGGWGGSYSNETVSNHGYSNASVNVPSGGAGASVNGADEMGLKPIKLRYEIEAVFTIN